MECLGFYLFHKENMLLMRNTHFCSYVLFTQFCATKTGVALSLASIIHFTRLSAFAS